MTSMTWIPGRPTREYPGYRRQLIKAYTLKERIDMAHRFRPEEFRRALKLNAESYSVETPLDIVRYVALLHKPMAKILDELEIPRELEQSEFVYFEGPFKKLRDEEEVVLRRIVPTLMKVDELTVQPMKGPVPMSFFRCEPVSLSL